MEEIKNEIEVEEKNNIYRLQEMVDEMIKSIDNAKKVKEEQKYLIEVLTKAEDEKLESLIKELNSQIESLNKQIETLNNRQIYIQKVVDVSNNNEEIKEVVNNLLLGLGVFN